MPKSNRISRGLLIAGFGLVALGVGGFILIFYKNTTALNETSINTNVTKNFDTDQRASLVSGNPVRIQIPSADINLDVEPGYYNRENGTWTLSKTAAHFATITHMLNNKEGNTFIYAHDLPGLFEPLRHLKSADVAYVYSDNGHKFTYTLQKVTVTSPNDTSLFDYSGPPMLTLQTCSGAWYEKRSLYWFDLVEVT